MIGLRLTKALTGLQTRLGRRALKFGVGESVEHHRLLQIEKWRTIIDVGANRGQFALAAHRHCPQADIISFEPLKAPANIFEEIFSDVSRVRVHRVGLGKSEGRSTMHVSARDDSSSLLPIGLGQVDIFPGTHEATTESVEVHRLDALLTRDDVKSPSLLKIDVQGFELEVLQGCRDLLPHIDTIYVESSLVELYDGQALFGDIVTWLLAHNFTLSDIGPIHRDGGRAIQGDFLFRRVGE